MAADHPTLARSTDATPAPAPGATWQRRGWWHGWRVRTLGLAAAALAFGLLALVRALGGEPHVAADWRVDDRGRLVLHAAADPALAAHAGQALVALVGADGRLQPVDALLVHAAPRWLPGDATRERLLRQQQAWREALATGTLTLEFADGGRATVQPAPRGVGRLGLPFWGLTALSLALGLAGAVALLSRPLHAGVGWRLAPFLGLAWAQALQGLGLAIASVPGPGVALGLGPALWPVPLALDFATALAALLGAALHPRPRRHAIGLAAAALAVALLLVAGAATGTLAHAWWWSQAALLAIGAAAVAALGDARTAHPLAPVLQRFGGAALGVFALLTLAAAAVGARGVTVPALGVGVVAWHGFVAALLLGLPWLPRVPAWLRLATSLVGVAAAAVAIDLLLGAALGLSPSAALAWSLAAALGLHAWARPWLARPLTGPPAPTAERLFDRLLRATRAIEAQPQDGERHLRELLAEVFEPRDVARSPRVPRRTRVFGAGSTLVVPLPPRRDTAAATGALVLRHAQHGQRLFTPDDAALADRLVEQLRHALSVDDALERGRREERTRLAQDLHDDIGARLLTLMYQAPTREMEDYVRHTLQDLKTLTRGLAASNRRLGDAAAEWKSDLGQRLGVAHCQLAWSLSVDRELELGVVQWSALTRLLRELVTNVIAHAHATRVEVEIVLDRDRLTLQVSDDGDGRDPQGWAAGLGLSSVRKRVRQLGGQVEWREQAPRGIRCRVTVPLPTPGAARPPAA